MKYCNRCNNPATLFNPGLCLEAGDEIRFVTDWTDTRTGFRFCASTFEEATCAHRTCAGGNFREGSCYCGHDGYSCRICQDGKYKEGNNNATSCDDCDACNAGTPAPTPT